MWEPGVQSRSRPPDGAASSSVITSSATTVFPVTRSVATSAPTDAARDTVAVMRGASLAGV